MLFAAEQIDFLHLDLLVVGQIYPAMTIRDALLGKDSLKLKFLKHILEKCQNVRVLYIDSFCRDEVLGLMSENLLSKLTK